MTSLYLGFMFTVYHNNTDGQPFYFVTNLQVTVFCKFTETK